MNTLFLLSLPIISCYANTPITRDSYQSFLHHFYPTFFQPNYFRSVPVQPSSPIKLPASNKYTHYPIQAQVRISSPTNENKVEGYINLFESYHGPIKIEGKLTGLSPGLHGFHIHEKGSIAKDCGATGGHFNPFNLPHGSPKNIRRHVGDLGNILADENGIAEISLTDNKVTLLGRNSVIGRAVVVHADEDDLGKGEDEGSLKTGNAGGRLACGVIGIASGLEKVDT